MPQMRGLFGQQRGRRQAGLRVDLQQHEAAGFARGVVVAEVAARGAAAAERAMRRERDVQRARVDVGMHARPG